MARKPARKSIKVYAKCCKCKKEKLLGDIVTMKKSPFFVDKKNTEYLVCEDCRELWLELIVEKLNAT